jgi:hypothetical protein
MIRFKSAVNANVSSPSTARSPNPHHHLRRSGTPAIEHGNLRKAAMATCREITLSIAV